MSVPAGAVGEEWIERYNGPASDWDQAYAIAVSEDGVFVTGTTYDFGPMVKCATVRYFPEGGLDWVATYESTFSGDCPSDIAADGSGHVYVTGKTGTESTGIDILTIKYSAAGDEVWAATYDGPASYWDEGSAIAVDDSGNVYVTGWRSPVMTSFDYVTIKYAPDGRELWATPYEGLAGSGGRARDVAVGADGGVYVTGTSTVDTTGMDIVTIRYDADGTEDWVARYNGPGNEGDEARALALDDSCNVYVVGISDSGDEDLVTIKYDRDGNEEWAVLYNGPSNHHDQGVDVAVTASGRTVVSGLSYDHSSGYDWLTISYSPGGGQLWLERYDGPDSGNDSPCSIVLDTAGTAYVTGRAGPVTTVRYGPSGGLEWKATYTGPWESDIPHGIAVDASDCVYITGESYDPSSAYDFFTIKYDPATGVADDELADPLIRLFPPNPNPCGGSTEVAFELVGDAPRATLAIYAPAGDLVTLVADGPAEAGRRTVEWDGTDTKGYPVAAGVYLIKLTAGETTATQKVVLVR